MNDWRDKFRQYFRSPYPGKEPDGPLDPYVDVVDLEDRRENPEDKPKVNMGHWAAGPYILQKTGSGEFSILAKSDEQTWDPIATVRRVGVKRFMGVFGNYHEEPMEGYTRDQVDLDTKAMAALFSGAWEQQLVIQMAIEELKKDPKYKGLVAHLRRVYAKARGLT